MTKFLYQSKKNFIGFGYSEGSISKTAQFYAFMGLEQNLGTAGSNSRVFAVLPEMAQEIDDIPNATRNFAGIIDRNQEELGTSCCKLSKHAYSMKELEAMRFVNVDDQERRWKEVYQSLGLDVVKYYDALRAPNQQTNKQKKKTTTATAAGKKIMEAPGMEFDNGVHLKSKGLKVDALPECVFSVRDLEKKGKTQQNGASEIQDVDGRMNKGKGDCGNSKGWSYSRSEIEALRFVNVSEQARWWNEVYHKLSLDIVEEFDGLRIPNNQKQQPRNAGWQQSAGKKMDPSKHLGDVLAQKSTTSPAVLNVGGSTDVEEPLDEYDNFDDEDDNSSDEHDSIQRPAFFVEGEPDFESGPPLDGLEYLRRVRWEAAQIPKVKVVRLNSSKLATEQTAYMPSIPEIPKCPPNLLPSKDWESAFLADFSELRQRISVQENSCNELSLAGKGAGKQSYCIQHLKQNTPTLTAVLGMDAVSRAAALRNSISSLETASVLSRDDCLWLFALCAAVDTPLHGDTCASLRCLLRKCSGLLALKSEPDDEVAMLSILVTITGKYFGQLDNL